MSITATSQAVAPPGSSPGPSATRRLALTLLAALGPLCVAVLRGILPYQTDDSSAAVIAKVAAQPAAESAVLWLSLAATFLLVPGTIAVGLYAVRRGPVLGMAALVLAVAGFSGLPAIVAIDQAAVSVARAGVPGELGARVLDELASRPTVAAATAIFVIGHILGVALLGIALWRGGILPAWAGAVLSLSQPAHLVFAVIVPNRLLDGCAWILTAAGFALAILYATRPADK